MCSSRLQKHIYIRSLNPSTSHMSLVLGRSGDSILLQEEDEQVVPVPLETSRNHLRAMTQRKPRIAALTVRSFLGAPNIIAILLHKIHVISTRRSKCLRYLTLPKGLRTRPLYSSKKVMFGSPLTIVIISITLTPISYLEIKPKPKFTQENRNRFKRVRSVPSSKKS